MQNREYRPHPPDAEMGAEMRGMLQAIAAEFAKGTLLGSAVLIHEGDKSNTYRCIKSSTECGVQGAEFNLDYRQYHEPSADKCNKMVFQFSVSGESGERVTIADMTLDIVDDKTFNLTHRYVRPEYRATGGIGTKLLGIAESWVQEVANQQKTKTKIELKTGQESVMHWLEKNGYRADPKSKKTRNRLRDHPERFVRDKVIISDDSKREGIVKDVYTFPAKEKGRYMENAVRLLYRKEFQPL